MMTERLLPRYPIYIPSKGRADCCYTAQCLDAAGVPFHLVVEPPEAHAYAMLFGKNRLLLLPFHDLGFGSIPSRNFIWEHAKASGAGRHWILDDNLKKFFRRYRAKRIECEPGIALRVAEDFTDRYENIAISGLNYAMFLPDELRHPPIILNSRIYSCLLIRTDLSFRWRGRYNEDTDLCLQVLSAGWCTVLMNTFLVEKMQTMTMKGGNSISLYLGDGRLKMARSLERMWPGVVETRHRYERPQHAIKYAWQHFDTPLKLKEGIDLASLSPNEYGMELCQVADEIKSPRLQALYQNWQEMHGQGRGEDGHA